MIDYYLITKPGIIAGNLITVAAGFFLASRGTPNWSLLASTLLGLALIIAAACVFNNYIDRHTDRQMVRTRQRPLVRGSISEGQALFFAACLFVGGNAALYAFTNLLTVQVADIGFLVYVVLYSPLKCRSPYSTAIGSIAGAVPPVVGYCAVTNQFDGGALLLFLLLLLWQMPHFHAIAIFNLDDYRAAHIPVLPAMRGMVQTKIHIALYVVGFMLSALLLTVFNYTGILYFSVALCAALFWLRLSIQGFTAADDQQWGRSMFRWSLVSIVALSVLIAVDVVP
jgi:protoheme IX farnesyltransferase